MLAALSAAGVQLEGSEQLDACRMVKIWLFACSCSIWLPKDCLLVTLWLLFTLFAETIWVWAIPVDARTLGVRISAPSGSRGVM